MWLLQVFSLLFLSLTSPCYGLSSCCSNETDVWNISPSCLNGKNALLNCPHRGYKVNPAELEDNFTIIDGDLHFSMNSLVVTSSSFCLRTDPESGNTTAIICFEKEEEAESNWRRIVFGILSFISAIFLITTFLVYAVLPELRDVQGKSLMGMIGALTAAYALLGCQKWTATFHVSDNVCETFAFFMYFSFLAAFFWMNIVSFDVWRSIWFQTFKISDKLLFLIYCILGWGGPLIFLIAAYSAHNTEGDHLKPGFAEISCWFEENVSQWAYFNGPMAFLIILNIIYFTLSCWRLWHQYRDLSGTKLRCLRFKFMLYMKLFLIMGISWIFEVVSFATGSEESPYWIPTDIYNSLQGLVIFLLLVATRKRVRKLLVKNRPFNINFPKTWAAGEDEECENDIPEEVVLS